MFGPHGKAPGAATQQVERGLTPHHAAQLVAGVCHWYQCLGAGSGASLLTIHHAHCHQLIGGQRAGLVKQAVAYFAARGDAEWLRAKDVCLGWAIGGGRASGGGASQKPCSAGELAGDDVSEQIR